MADDPVAALLELLSPGSDAGIVSAELLAARTLWILHVSEETEVADATDRRSATFGMTKELSAVTPYSLPQAWADALHDGGHGGIRWWLRLDPDQGRGVALFGHAGPGDRGPAVAMPALTAREDIERQTSLRILDVPASRQLDWVP